MKKDITFLIPSMAGGGAQKVTLLLINELCRKGWKVTILLSRAEGPYLKKLDKSLKIIILKNRNISKNIFSIAKYLKQNNPRIFYSSMTYVNVIAGLAVILSRFKGKVIFSEHMNLSKKNIDNPNFINGVITFLAKKVYKKADAIVCVSKGVKDDLNQVIHNIKKSLVIYNPIENFYKEKKDNSKFKIISLGRLVEQKNYSLLINAFSIVTDKCANTKKELELYIFGEGYEREKLNKLISQFKLQDKVFLPGFVDNSADLLSSSDLFVLSSNREGFPLVLPEALSCGLPVISTDCPSGPSEILKKGQLGKLVPVDDVESMAEAIIEAINNPDKYSTREERMLRAKDFSVENVVNQYESLFEEICM
jgi:glycosyltransferase involved in cell wall biosynthesis